jgi:ubiquinone/menaquinone biosynthesis C-methylase UbiE
LNNDQAIYHHQTDQYEKLVSREDYQGNLLHAINDILPLMGLNVLELGAGTGRLTRLLAPLVRNILALDSSLPMLEVARQTLNDLEIKNRELAVADHRNLPIKENLFDLVISGWSICYLVSPGAAEPYPHWQAYLDTAFREMDRSLRLNGTIIIIETMGTGFETPHPPAHLKAYFQWLKDHGFSSTWIRTDYQFKSIEEAETLTRFFFGEKLANEVVEKDWVILPECTGIWWKGKKESVISYQSLVRGEW